MQKVKRMKKMSAGDRVEIQSKDETLRSLDITGQLDVIPFMPELSRFFCQRLHVPRRAHKTSGDSTPHSYLLSTAETKSRISEGLASYYQFLAKSVFHLEIKPFGTIINAG
jgi:hypothetical protein